jgi:hypothetical protein
LYYRGPHQSFTKITNQTQGCTNSEYCPFSTFFNRSQPFFPKDIDAECQAQAQPTSTSTSTSSSTQTTKTTSKSASTIHQAASSMFDLSLLFDKDFNKYFLAIAAIIMVALMAA